MNQDFVDLLRELSAAEARYLVVGAYAVALHATPRATGDLDVWVDSSPANAERVARALRAFGAPLDDLKTTELATGGLVYQIGLPPRRVDILTSLTGIVFEEAWASRVMGKVEGTDYPFIGRDELIRNKRALGRPRDLADLDALGA